MSQEHEKTSSGEEQETSAIRPEPPPFEAGYQPESLPKITVPDLPEDAESLSAEALSQVPTLTELVHQEPGDSEENSEKVVIDDAPPDSPTDVEAQAATDEVIQEEPIQADTWTEVLHARMGKLTDEIHTLNARLDRLEEIIKIEV